MISINFKSVEKELKHTKIKLKTVIAKTLTNLARDAAKDVNKKIPYIFKTPVAFTKNSAKFYKANPRKIPLNSRVLILDTMRTPGTPPAKYLQNPAGQQGVSRPSENKLIRQKKLDKEDHLFTPNLKKKTIAKWVKILSGVKHYDPTGKVSYFIKESKNKKVKTVFKITRLKTKNKITPEFFAKKVRKSKKIFHFDDIVRRYVSKNIDKTLQKIIDREIDSAMFKQHNPKRFIRIRK